MTTAKSSDDGKRGRDGEDPGSFSETEVKKCRVNMKRMFQCLVPRSRHHSKRVAEVDRDDRLGHPLG